MQTSVWPIYRSPSSSEIRQYASCKAYSYIWTIVSSFSLFCDETCGFSRKYWIVFATKSFGTSIKGYQQQQTLTAQLLSESLFSVKRRSGGYPYLVFPLMAFTRTQESSCSTSANVQTKSWKLQWLSTAMLWPKWKCPIPTSTHCQRFAYWSILDDHMISLKILLLNMWIDHTIIWIQNGRESLGDVMHRYITSDQFSADCLLDCLEFSSEHQALEIANRLEASIYMWRQKTTARPKSSTVRSNPRSSWGKVKDKMIDAEKRELFADRAESLLICLKQRFPGLTQTTLDMSKIQCNKVSSISFLRP